jgi:hypothetical protein
MNNTTNIQHSTFNIEHPMARHRVEFLGCWAFDVEC